MVVNVDFMVVLAPQELKHITDAFADFHKYTCLRFVVRKAQKNYLDISDGGGCFSEIGMQGGRQDVSLTGTCFKVRKRVH